MQSSVNSTACLVIFPHQKRKYVSNTICTIVYKEVPLYQFHLPLTASHFNHSNKNFPGVLPFVVDLAWFDTFPGRYNFSLIAMSTFGDSANYSYSFTLTGTNMAFHQHMVGYSSSLTPLSLSLSLSLDSRLSLSLPITLFLSLSLPSSFLSCSLCCPPPPK